jgi:hypothetical protein
MVNLFELSVSPPSPLNVLQQNVLIQAGLSRYSIYIQQFSFACVRIMVAIAQHAMLTKVLTPRDFLGR